MISQASSVNSVRNLIFMMAASSIFALNAAAANDIATNEVNFIAPPAWITREMVVNTTKSIEEQLSGSSTRKIKVYYMSDSEKFNAEHKLSFPVGAFFRPKDQTVYLGPTVNKDNFERFFGHELVHVIFSQKFKAAIPLWLEEGLANYYSGRKDVNWKWLAKQPSIDVTSLRHPGNNSLGADFHYQTSTAVIIFISERCSLKELLMLSVGKKLENYLATFCKIKNLNGEYATWLAKK